MRSAPAAAAPRRVLVVCHANTSRSIIAEAVLLRLIRERGLDGRVTVSSGGIAPYARDGSLVSLDAKFVLREIGIPEPPKPGATDLISIVPSMGALDTGRTPWTSSTMARRSSATLHACAMQPTGRCGGSPSNISETWPSPASLVNQYRVRWPVATSSLQWMGYPNRGIVRRPSADYSKQNW